MQSLSLPFSHQFSLQQKQFRLYSFHLRPDRLRGISSSFSCLNVCKTLIDQDFHCKPNSDITWLLSLHFVTLEWSSSFSRYSRTFPVPSSSRSEDFWKGRLIRCNWSQTICHPGCALLDTLWDKAEVSQQLFRTLNIATDVLSLQQGPQGPAHPRLKYFLQYYFCLFGQF